MLEQLRVQGFKSLLGVDDLVLPRLAVLFGPNAAGKSNLIDAIQALSRLASSRTVEEALTEPIRGIALEMFSLPGGGLQALLRQESASFALDAVLRVGRDRFRYRVTVETKPETGALMVADEYLASLTRTGSAKGNPSIERVGRKLRIRRKSKPAHPREEDIGLNHTVLSDPRLTSPEYADVQKCRDELSGWRTYYLDPRVAMRQPKAPSQAKDIGSQGELIAPFLHHLRNAEPRRFDTVRRTLRALVPDIEGLEVRLNERRAELDIEIIQRGTPYSSRIVSEGTLRVLALCALAASPWAGGVLAFEEPENGVHPRRLELIAELLVSLALGNRQLIVTTHSPLLCGAMLQRSRANPDLIGLYSVRQTANGSAIWPFAGSGVLFEDQEILAALNADDPAQAFEGLLLRGLLDG